jgi:hypothetical protein
LHCRRWSSLRQRRTPLRQFIPSTAVENGASCVILACINISRIVRFSFACDQCSFLDAVSLLVTFAQLFPMWQLLPCHRQADASNCSAPHIWLRCPDIAHYALLDGLERRISERKASLSLKREHRARCWQIDRTWSANEGHGGANDGAVGSTPHAPINTDGAALATTVVSCLPSPFSKRPLPTFTPQDTH